jgi:NadR type nicotinamide-nucleotide adenylyltransferase
LAAAGTRVCLIGPECTGKTTLAERLSVELSAPWVPEFARAYAERVRRPLTVDDVAPIALGQIALDDAAVNDGLLILDTDLMSTVVYSRHYYGACPEWIEREAEARMADLYLLASIDGVPWTDDAVRDPAAARVEFVSEFESTLRSHGANVASLAGSWDERFATAADAIRRLDSRPGRSPAAGRIHRR